MSVLSVRKTFDDTYGRHALVYTDDSDAPLFGRVDVMHIIPWRMHPSRVREDYRPTHMVGVAGSNRIGEAQ